MIRSAKNPQLLRVLVADDDKDGANSLGALLGMMGHKVQEAYNGYETVIKAESWYPHIILLDLTLPGINGYEVIEKIRLNPLTRHCVVAALTGHVANADRARTKEHGFDLHLAKPIDLDDLRKLLDAVVAYDGAERRQDEKPYSGAEKRRKY